MCWIIWFNHFLHQKTVSPGRKYQIWADTNLIHTPQLEVLWSVFEAMGFCDVLWHKNKVEMGREHIFQKGFPRRKSPPLKQISGSLRICLEMWPKWQDWLVFTVLERLSVWVVEIFSKFNDWCIYRRFRFKWTKKTKIWASCSMKRSPF